MYFKLILLFFILSLFFLKTRKKIFICSFLSITVINIFLLPNNFINAPINYLITIFILLLHYILIGYFALEFITYKWKNSRNIIKKLITSHMFLLLIIFFIKVIPDSKYFYLYSLAPDHFDKFEINKLILFFSLCISSLFIFLIGHKNEHS